MTEIILPIISATSSIAVAVIGLIGARIKAVSIRKLAASQDQNVLAASEIDPSSTLPMPPVAFTSSVSEGKQACVSLVYPGARIFRSSSITYREGMASEYDIDVDFSNINISIDGKETGSGDGYKGFRLEVELGAGRHTLTARWTGERQKYQSDRGHRTLRDLSGYAKSYFWITAADACAIHLDEGFTVEHCEPRNAIAGCALCSWPAKHRCRCGSPYCDKHAETLGSTQVCKGCLDRRTMLYFRGAQILSGLVALISIILWMRSH